MFTIELLDQIRLTDNKVRQLILKSVDLVKETREELNLPIFTQISETKQRLQQGTLRAGEFSTHHSDHIYSKIYGYFKAPSTIVLDANLPLEGQLFNQSELATTATYYCAVHEVIHADDYTDGQRIVNHTLRHVKNKHEDELAEAEKFLSQYSRRALWSHSKKSIINTWTYQYVDSATHYRTYLVLRHKKFPKINTIWVSLYNSIFSPRLFTTLEHEKGIYYTTSLLSNQIGQVCIIEIAKECEEIAQKKLKMYTV